MSKTARTKQYHIAGTNWTKQRRASPGPICNGMRCSSGGEGEEGEGGGGEEKGKEISREDPLASSFPCALTTFAQVTTGREQSLLSLQEMNARLEQTAAALRKAQVCPRHVRLFRLPPPAPPLPSLIPRALHLTVPKSPSHEHLAFLL